MSRSRLRELEEFQFSHVQFLLDLPEGDVANGSVVAKFDEALTLGGRRA